MHLLQNKKNKVIFFISIFILIALLISAVFILLPKKTEDYAVSFLSVDSKYADSLISVMTIEEKVEQLIISENINKKSNIAGIIIDFDSLEQINNFYKNSFSNKKIIPFVCNNNSVCLTKILTNKYFAPNAKTLLSITDTILLNEFIDFTIRNNNLLGFNFVFAPQIDELSDSSITNLEQITFYQNFINKFSNKYTTDYFLYVLQFEHFSYSDSTIQNFKNKFYIDNFKKGINAIYISDNKDIDIAIKQFDFKGLIIGKAENFTDLKLFLESDFDILICNDSTYNTVNELVRTVKSKNKYLKLLNKKVKKILLAKTWLKENKKQLVNKIITKDSVLNYKNEILFRKINKNSISILKNKNNLLPIQDVNQISNCYIFGENDCEIFSNIIKNYTEITVYNFSGTSKDFLSKIKVNGKPNLLFVLNDVIIDSEFANKMYKFDSLYNLTLVILKNESNLKYLSKFKHIIFSWDNSNYSQFYTAQIIYGGFQCQAKLPIQISDSIKFNSGINITKIRVGYDIPEMVGLSSIKLQKIDSIVNDGISRFAFPGCQVFVAKDGIVVWDKSYGFHTYDHANKVQHNDLYDIASVTKIAATTISAMKLYEQGKLSLDQEIGKYFKNTKIEYDRIKPDTVIKIDTINIFDDKNWQKKIKNLDTLHLGDSLIIAFDTIIYKLTPKNNIFKVTPRQLLVHESGVQPAMPIYKLMLLDTKYLKKMKKYYSKGQDSLSFVFGFAELRNKMYSNRYIKDSSTVQVAEGMYLNKSYFDTLWRDTKALPVVTKKVYIYSDVNMILLQLTIDSINKMSIDKFTEKTFYQPLGLKYITFLPRKKFDRNRIVPTESEAYFRKQLICGHVHDPSAALMGGVAGNAGLFSNAYSLGILGQMLLNGGTYGGKRFLSESTISQFSATQANTYRGLGFDKWSKKQICASDASPNTYGHTGFTGACMWIDPDNKIVYTFLSNRVHPSSKNWKLNNLKIRQKVHQAVYNSRI